MYLTDFIIVMVSAVGLSLLLINAFDFSVDSHRPVAADQTRAHRTRQTRWWRRSDHPDAAENRRREWLLMAGPTVVDLVPVQDQAELAAALDAIFINLGIVDRPPSKNSDSTNPEPL